MYIGRVFAYSMLSRRSHESRRRAATPRVRDLLQNCWSAK